MNKEKYIKYMIPLSIALSVVVIYAVLALVTLQKEEAPILGISFSSTYATSLGLNWRQTYLTLLDELGVKYVRLGSYWDISMPERDVYDYEELDWMIQQAESRGVHVVLTLGMRQPRWPECHIPQWAQELEREEFDQELLNFVEKTVMRYKEYESVEVWQVENEPLLASFGECPFTDKKLLEKEIELVRSLDTRPILVTASGELSTWRREANLGDYFGSTLYRKVWVDSFGVKGFWSYWFIPSSWYRIKAFVMTGGVDRFWIAELQAEPWFNNHPLDTSLEDQYESLSPQQLKENIAYAVAVNPRRIYLWGAEWWVYTRNELETTAIWEVVSDLKW
jgi:hypothetical protein